jgi:hypothetical protein
MSAPDWFSLIAWERGLPMTWQWFSSAVVDNHFLVTGAVCSARFLRGPRKGLLNWAKRDKETEQTIVISRTELAVFRQRWEQESGRCYDCGGGGKEHMGWKIEHGTILKTCRRCKGSGKPPATERP